MIKRISEAEFNTYKPSRSQGNYLDEKSWFSDEAGNVIGTVILDNHDNDWSAVVMGRDEHGTFRAIDFRVSFPSHADAEKFLRETMVKHEESGQTVFPQGD